MAFERAELIAAMALKISGRADGVSRTACSLAERSFVELARVCRQQEGRPAVDEYTLVREDFGGAGTLTSQVFSAGLERVLSGAFEAAGPTWRRWANRAGQGRLSGDFTTPYPAAATEEVGPGEKIPLAGQGGRRTDIVLKKHARILAVTDECLLSDDMGYVRRLVRQEGNALARAQDAAAVTALTTVSSFFAAATGNLRTSATFTAVTFAAAVLALRSMKIEKVEPHYRPGALLIPAALEATAHAISSADGHVRGGDETEIVVQSELDANSATTWYVVADRGQADTIILDFLAGFEQPEVIRLPRKLDFDGIKYRIKQVFAAAAVNPFAIIKNTA